MNEEQRTQTKESDNMLWSPQVHSHASYTVAQVRSNEAEFPVDDKNLYWRC